MFVETEECTEHDTVPKDNMLYFFCTTSKQNKDDFPLLI